MSCVVAFDESLFPEISEPLMVFPAGREFRAVFEPILAAAKAHTGDLSVERRWFATLFYEGGRMVQREGIDDASFRRASRVLRMVMGSFDPKHQDKEVAAAFILAQIAGSVERT